MVPPGCVCGGGGHAGAPPMVEVGQGVSNVVDSTMARISSTRAGGVSERYIASMIVTAPSTSRIQSSSIWPWAPVVASQGIVLRAVADELARLALAEYGVIRHVEDDRLPHVSTDRHVRWLRGIARSLGRQARRDLGRRGDGSIRLGRCRSAGVPVHVEPGSDQEGPEQHCGFWQIRDLLALPQGGELAVERPTGSGDGDRHGQSVVLEIETAFGKTGDSGARREWGGSRLRGGRGRRLSPRSNPGSGQQVDAHERDGHHGGRCDKERTVGFLRLISPRVTAVPALP
jgi:hypothetical protein